MMKEWLFLGVAIIAEIFATTLIKSSEGFTKLLPSALVIIGYIVTFYFLSLSVKTIPIGIAYAVWAGLGVVFVALLGWLFYGDSLNLATIIGMLLIIVGVVIINLFGSTQSH